MTAHSITARQARSITAWVLVAGFLLQPLLSYLVTPWATADARGHLVVMCTLNGLKQVYVDPADPDQTTQVDSESCPALTLWQLASSAQTPAPLAIVPGTLYLVGELRSTAVSPRHASPDVPYLSRAPPLV